jgi:uncharacterized RDD family membrane protein YckC
VPPQADVDPTPRLEIPADLATLRQRFVAASLDTGFVLVPCWLAAEGLKPASIAPWLVVLICLVVFLAIEVVQWRLIARRGQSFGKIIAGTRIVLAEGHSTPSFHAVVVLRDWSRLVLAPTPLGILFCIVDALFVFRRDRRCVHDHIAGTIVIRN